MQPVSKEYREYIAAELPELSAELVEAIETTDPVVSVRLNRRKQPSTVTAGSVLDVAAAGGDAVPWCSSGFYLAARPDFTHDVAMHQGAYYVQDASSMIVGHVVASLACRLQEEAGGLAAPLRYLDACAAPGGKTTAAIDALPSDALVVANEFDYRRAEVLRENVMKWGHPHVAVSRGDTARFSRLGGWFDIVAADVPCSGEGMMRKDETARTQWSPSLVRECAARQWEIVCNLWPALAPGGYFIYSTCTFNRTENELMVERMEREFGACRVELPVPSCGIVEHEGMMRFLPGRIRGEGLFMAVLRKPGLYERRGVVQASVTKGGKNQKGRKGARSTGSPVMADAALQKILSGWLDGDFVAFCRDDVVEAVAMKYAPMIAELDKALDLILRGVDAGRVKGPKIAPAQGLALSQAFRTDAFARVEVETATALQYLRRESLGGFDAPRGWILLTYGGLPLGFVNNLGSRSNNPYPQSWRILH